MCVIGLRNYHNYSLALESWNAEYKVPVLQASKFLSIVLDLASHLNMTNNEYFCLGNQALSLLSHVVILTFLSK